MSDMEFRIDSSFDPDAFESALQQQVNEGLLRYAERLQAALDDLHGRMAGHPIEDVKTALRTTWQETTEDGDITDPELTAFAQAIAEGKRIVLDTTEFHV